MKKKTSVAKEKEGVTEFTMATPCQLLHFLQGSPKRPLSVLFIPGLREQSKEWCAFANHGKSADLNCYRVFQFESGYFDYLKQFSNIADFLSSEPAFVRDLNELIQILENPVLNSTLDDFNKNLDLLAACVDKIEEEIHLKLHSMTCLETQRLGESFVCFRAESYTASVTMAATAIEARLHYLVNKNNKKLYQQQFAKKTLGGIIEIFDKNAYKDKKYNGLKKIVPERHKPLLDLINTYRIFSAHPKVTSLDYTTARTILLLSCLFLLDPMVKPEGRVLPTCPNQSEHLRCSRI